MLGLLAVQLSAGPWNTAQVITPFSMYFNARLIFQKYEVWRLFTNFLFFGSLGALLCLLVQGYSSLEIATPHLPN